MSSRKNVLCFFTALSLVLPQAILADALPWTNPWFVMQLTTDQAGSGVGSSAFGAGATKNGDITDLKNDLAVARASGSAVSTLDGNSFGEGTVEFFRNFTLKGSPAGWDVTLFGTLTGSLYAQTSDDDVSATATVQAIAEIIDAAGDPVMEIGETPWDTGVIRGVIDSGKSGPVLSPLSTAMILPNGNYSVYGKIKVFAGTDKGGPGIASANSLFFDSLVVGGSATPLPEPSVLALLALGLIPMIAVAGRCGRRSSREDRC